MAPKNGTHYTAVDLPPKVLLGVDPEWGPTRTKQSEAKATNINTIVAQYDRTGVLPTDGRQALFADVADAPDYRTALDLIRNAEELFMDIPATVRARFENDPAVFLDFTSDPDNRAEMVEMGLLEAPEPVVVPVVEPAIVPVVAPATPVVEPAAPVIEPAPPAVDTGSVS